MQKASQLSRPSPALKTSRVNTSYSTALSKLSPSPRAAMFRKGFNSNFTTLHTVVCCIQNFME